MKHHDLLQNIPNYSVMSIKLIVEIMKCRVSNFDQGLFILFTYILCNWTISENESAKNVH